MQYVSDIIIIIIIINFFLHLHKITKYISVLKDNTIHSNIFNIKGYGIYQWNNRINNIFGIKIEFL